MPRGTKPAKKPWVGEGTMPIYRHELPGLAWQLLWWLCTKMDTKGEVRGGWRTAASGDIGKNRIWLGRCAVMLTKRGLIDTKPGQRSVRVNVQNFVG